MVYSSIQQLNRIFVINHPISVVRMNDNSFICMMRNGIHCIAKQGTFHSNIGGALYHEWSLNFDELVDIVMLKQILLIIAYCYHN